MATQQPSNPTPRFNWLYESTAGTSSFKVAFPNTPNIELILIGAELIQKINQHDILILNFKGKAFKDTTVLVSGDPVIFEWTSGPNKSTFNGYIYELNPSSGTAVHETTIICISASYVLKDTDQKIYKNLTADAVVGKIAKANNMQAITERHPRTRDSIVQAGQSHWQMLRRLANQTGYALRVENTTIYFMSKDKIYSTKKSSAPYFKYEDGVTVAQRMYGTCFKFHPELSDENPDRNVQVKRVMTGTAGTTGTAIKTTHSPKNFKKVQKGSVTPSKDYFNV